MPIPSQTAGTVNAAVEFPLKIENNVQQSGETVLYEELIFIEILAGEGNELNFPVWKVEN